MDVLLEVFNEELGKTLTKEDVTTYALHKSYGVSKEEELRVWEERGEEILDRSLPIWNLDEFIESWKTYKTEGKDKNEIIIVTSRNKTLQDLTASWLKRNDVSYDELHLGFSRKVDAVRELGLDVLVDDKGECIKEVEQDYYLDCETYLVNRPYNQWYGTPNRVYVEDMPTKV